MEEITPITASLKSQTIAPSDPVLQLPLLCKRYVYHPRPPNKVQPTELEKNTLLQGWAEMFSAFTAMTKDEPSLTDRVVDVALRTAALVKQAYQAMVDAVKQMFEYVKEKFELIASVITMIATSLMKMFKERSQDVVRFFKTIFSYFPSSAPVDITAEQFQSKVEGKSSYTVVNEDFTQTNYYEPHYTANPEEVDTVTQGGTDTKDDVDVGVFAYIIASITSMTLFFEGLGTGSGLEMSVNRFTKTLSTCCLVERFDLYGKSRKVANIVYHFITGTHLFEDYEKKAILHSTFQEINELCLDFANVRHPPLSKIRKLRRLRIEFASAYEYCICAFPRDGQQHRSMKQVVDEKVLRFIGASLSNQRRIKPIVILLVGPAGCGKTTVQDAIIGDTMQMIAKIYTDLGPESPGLDIFRDHASRPSHMSRNCVEKSPEYDDGYNECLFYCLEEFLSVKNAVLTQEWVSKLFALADTQALMLNMAFGDKGQRFFDSPFILVTGNPSTIQVSFEDPEAFYRRIDFCLNVSYPKKGAFNIDHVKFSVRPESQKILNHTKFPHSAYKTISFQDPNFTVENFDYTTLLSLIVMCYLERNNPDNASQFKFSRAEEAMKKYDFTKLPTSFISARSMKSISQTSELVVRHDGKEKDTSVQGPGDDKKVPLHVLYQKTIHDLLLITPPALHKCKWIANKVQECIDLVVERFKLQFRQHRTLTVSPYLGYVELRKALLGKEHIIKTTWNARTHNIQYIQKTIIWFYSEMSALRERALRPSGAERCGEISDIGPMPLRKAYCLMTSRQRENIRILVKNESLPWKFGITVSQEQNNIRIIEGRAAFLARRRDKNRIRKRAADDKRDAMREAARHNCMPSRSDYNNIEIVDRSLGLGNWADDEEMDYANYHDEFYSIEDERLYRDLVSDTYRFEEKSNYEEHDVVRVEKNTRIQGYVQPKISQQATQSLESAFKMLSDDCWDGKQEFSLFRMRTPYGEIFDEIVTDLTHYKACLARYYVHFKLEDKGVDKYTWIAVNSSGMTATGIYELSVLRDNIEDPVLGFVYTCFTNSTPQRNKSISIDQARRILQEAQYSPPFKAMNQDELDFASFATDMIHGMNFTQCVISGIKRDAVFDNIAGVISSLIGVAITAGIIAMIVKLALPVTSPLEGMSKAQKSELYESLQKDTTLQSLDVKKLQVHPKIKNTFAKFQEKHKTALQSGADDCLFKKVMSNMYVCCLPSGAVAGTIFFVGGGIAIMPLHVYEAIPYFRLLPYVPEIALKFPSMSTFSKDSVKVLYQDTRRDEVHLAFSDIRRHPKLVDHLMLDKEYSSEFTQPVMLTFDQHGTFDGRVESVSNITKFEEPRDLNILSSPPLIVDHRINYDWNGAIAGACGAIGMAKIGGRYKLCWRHTSGSAHEHYGTGLPLSYERIIGYFSTTHEGPSTMIQCGEDICFSDVDYLVVDGVPAYEYVDGEFITPIMTSPTNKTVFRPTPFVKHKFRGGATTAPACTDNEAYENARAKADEIADVLNPNPEISPIVDQFCFPIMKLFHTIPAKHIVGCHRITGRQALYGYKNLGPLSKKTSDGIRLRLMKIRKLALEDPDSLDTEQFLAYIEYVDGVVKSTGIFPLQINVDCLKDETRHNDKVLKKATRLFNITDFVDNVLIKMAIGDLVSRTSHTLMLDPAMCGINPVSSYWLDLFNKFAGFSVVFTDIKGWDYTNVLWTLRIIGPYLYLAYGHDREALRWAMWSFISCLYAIRFNRRKGRVLGRGNTSGNWATTYWNTLVNIVFHGVACVHGALKNGADPLLALANLKLAIYSDDNVSACPGHLWWNTRFLSMTFDYLYHITLTATDKGETKDLLYTIEEAEFLSRRFVKRNGIVYAPLSLDSLLSQLYWVRAPKKYATREFILSQLQINIDNVMRELIEYEPKEAWDLTNEIQNFIYNYSIPVIVKPFDFNKQVELKLSYY